MGALPRRVVLVIVALTAASSAQANQTSGTVSGIGACAAHGRGVAEYSEEEYACLRRRFEPHQPAANGPLPASALAVNARAIRMELSSRAAWPIVRDVIYGDTVALNRELDHGLNPSMRLQTFMYGAEPVNESLLDLAIVSGQRDVMRLLLAHHAFLNPSPADEEEGRAGYLAPLPYAAQFSEDDVIRMLLAHGANIEQKNNFRPNRAPENHETALAAAVLNGDVAGVYLLLTRGANVKTALGLPYSCDAKSRAILQLLDADGAKIRSPCEIDDRTQ